MVQWFLNKITFTGPESAISQLVKHYNKSPYLEKISQEKYSFFNTLFYTPSSLFCHPDAPEDFTLRSKIRDDLFAHNLQNLGCTFVGVGYLETRETGLAIISLFTRYDTPLIGLARIANIPEYSDLIIKVSYHRVPTSTQSEITNYPSGFCQLKNGRFFLKRQENKGRKIKKIGTIKELLANHEITFDNKIYLFLEDSKYVRGGDFWRKDLDFTDTSFEKTHQQIQDLPTCLKINYQDKWLFIIHLFVMRMEDNKIVTFYQGEMIYKDFDDDDNYHLFFNRQFTLEQIFKRLRIKPDFVSPDLTQIIELMESIADELNPVVINKIKELKLKEEYANLKSKLKGK